MRIATCLSMLVARCGGAVGPEAGRATDDDGRQVGNPTIAEAITSCRAFGLTDDLIEVLFIVTEGHLEAGFTKVEEVDSVFGACSDEDDVLRCNVCFLAVVDIVYRE